MYRTLAMRTAITLLLQSIAVWCAPVTFKEGLVLLGCLCGFGLAGPMISKQGFGGTPRVYPGCVPLCLVFKPYPFEFLLQHFPRWVSSCALFLPQVGLGGLTVAPQGVHVAGSFQDWNPSSTATFLVLSAVSCLDWLGIVEPYNLRGSLTSS